MLSSISVDFQKTEPIYYQVAEQIKLLICSGVLEPGDQLPSSRELAEQLAVNFNTIARVYRVLDDQGYVSTQHGRGCYVLGSVMPEKERKARLFTEFSDAYRRDCHALGFSDQDIVDYWQQFARNKTHHNH